MKDEKNEKNYDKVEMACWVIVGFIFVVLFTILIKTGIDDTKTFKEEMERIELEEQRIETRVVQLYSINLNNQTEGEMKGKFILGSGSVKEKTEEKYYYVAYQILDNGGKILFKMPADVTIIFDILESDASAYAEVDENALGIQEVRLFIPENTIQQEYDFSLE